MRVKNMSLGNKKTVTDFYEFMFCRRDLAQASKFISKNYVQHNNSFIPPGQAGFVGYFSKFIKIFKQSGVEIKKVCCEGDIVFLYANHWAKLGPFTIKCKVIDIYKVRDGILTEHWDTIEGVNLFSRCFYLIKALFRL